MPPAFIAAKGVTIAGPVSDALSSFIAQFAPAEHTQGVPLLVLGDECSSAVYTICHLDAKVILQNADLDAVLDPDESDEYKLNRDLYTDNFAYTKMAADSIKGRSFEDLVVEYDTSYRPDLPLKVFGGQHRIQAIGDALEDKVDSRHGLQVYFQLTTTQRLDIATVNNTSIAVPNDLLDRMQEEFLGPELRTWCQGVGLLASTHNFTGRRSADGVPTVRVARTLVVNFFLGAKLADKAFATPIICTSGTGIDKDYQTIRDTIDWKDSDFKRMGKEFTRLHHLQRERVLSQPQGHHVEYSNKAIHLSIAAGWAFAAGVFQHSEKELANHYRLPDIATGTDDPLNAPALRSAKLTGIDHESYRGVGSRISKEEAGRVLEVFRLQASPAVKKPGITKQLAVTAIKAYEAKKSADDYQKALKKL